MTAPTPSGRSAAYEAPDKADFVIDDMPDKTVLYIIHNLCVIIYESFRQMRPIHKLES